jgi:hypothetical protein
MPRSTNKTDEREDEAEGDVDTASAMDGDEPEDPKGDHDDEDDEDLAEDLDLDDLAAMEGPDA